MKIIEKIANLKLKKYNIEQEIKTLIREKCVTILIQYAEGRHGKQFIESLLTKNKINYIDFYWEGLEGTIGNFYLIIPKRKNMTQKVSNLLYNTLKEVDNKIVVEIIGD